MLSPPSTFCRRLLYPLTAWIFYSLLASCGHLGGSEARCPPPRETFEADECRVTSSYPVNISVKGQRPVLLLHELNGQSPGCLSLGKELADAGCKVYIPRFYGAYGNEVSVFQWPQVICSRKWNLLSPSGGTIRDDIREIAHSIQKRHPGRPLTVIGNCMTGGQALALLSEPGIDTAVVCQPAAPMVPCGDLRKKSFGVPPATVVAAVHAMRENPQKRLISFNYRNDPVACFARTEELAHRTVEAGVEKQHDLYIGLPPGISPNTDLITSGQPHPGWHPLQVVGAGTPHSTVTGAKGKDLDLFRDQLFGALGLPRRARLTTVARAN